MFLKNFEETAKLYWNHITLDVFTKNCSIFLTRDLFLFNVHPYYFKNFPYVIQFKLNLSMCTFAADFYKIKNIKLFLLETKKCCLNKILICRASSHTVLLL